MHQLMIGAPLMLRTQRIRGRGLKNMTYIKTRSLC